MTNLTRTLRNSLPILAVLAAMAAMPATAAAGSDSATTCSTAHFADEFAQWGDSSDYALAAGGSIEGPLAGWTLRGDVARVAGNEPHHLNDEDDRYSLLLEQDSSVTTRALCAGLVQPTMRFFATGSPDSLLQVEVVLENARGGAASAPMGVIAGTGSWEASPVMDIAELADGVGDDGTAISFRFTPLTGSWQIDDVYVDPYRQR